MGTPNALSDASTICLRATTGVSAGRLESRSPARVTRARSSRSIPAASNTPSKSTWPPGAAGGSDAKTPGMDSAGTSADGDGASAAAGPASSRSMNQPRTVDPQFRCSLMDCHSAGRLII